MVFMFIFRILNILFGKFNFATKFYVDITIKLDSVKLVMAVDMGLSFRNPPRPLAGESFLQGFGSLLLR